jgi:glycerate-2-kinase
MPIKGVEASLIYEDNHRMRGAMEKLGARIYKTYRIWSLPLTEAAADRPEEVADGPTFDGPTADSATEVLEVIPQHILNAKATIDDKPMADLSSEASKAAKQALDEDEK